MVPGQGPWKMTRYRMKSYKAVRVWAAYDGGGVQHVIVVWLEICEKETEKSRIINVFLYDDFFKHKRIPITEISNRQLIFLIFCSIVIIR